MSTRQMVIFNIGNESYGVDIGQVIEINKMLNIVKAPNTPEFIEGLVNLRGKAYAVYNLRKKFRLPAKEFDEGTKIIIIKVNFTDIGFIVDGVNEIIRVEDENIEEAPGIITGINRKYISGVAKVGEKMMILLDLNLILSEAEEEAVANLQVHSL